MIYLKSHSVSDIANEKFKIQNHLLQLSNYLEEREIKMI